MARARGEDGVSLLEVVVALTIFAVFAAGVYAMLDSGLNLSRNNRNRSIGANLASQEMDRVRATKFADLPLGRVESVQAVDGVEYLVRRDTGWQPADGVQGGSCETSAGSPMFLRVTVTVHWDAMRGVAPVESSTALTPPVGSFQAGKGRIAVVVRDRAGEPAGGHRVVVKRTGYSIAPQNTTEDGCAYFPFLDPGGPYTVEVTTAGYVNPQGVEFPTASVTVGVEQSHAVEFDYDEAATLDVSLVAPEGGTMPSALPVTLGHTTFVPSGTRTFAGTGPSRSIPALFPTPSGYALWGGSCADADPEAKVAVGDGVFEPIWSGASRSDPIATDPGATSAATIELSTVEIAVVKRLGNDDYLPLPGAAVRVRHAADAGCAAVDLPAGSADGGGLLAAALPFGEWWFAVAGESPVGAWTDYSVTIDPRDASPGDPAGPFNVIVVVQ